jgi:hypothetical protein
MRHRLEEDVEVEYEQAAEAGSPQASLKTFLPEPPVPTVTIGSFVTLDPELGPMVDFALNRSGKALLARTLVPVEQRQVGSEIALVFEDGVITRPIIVGVIQGWNAPAPDRLQRVQQATVAVKHDEDSLLLTAEKEITLQCGKASITLTNAGKLLLRGAYLLSRSSGVNRIKGGSVQIN